MMKVRSLIVALAVAAGATLLAPGTAEAAHRHSRHCHHRGHDVSRYYRAPRYDSYRYQRDSRYDRDYRYGRGYGYRYGRVWAPEPRFYGHYHRGARCHRRHAGFYFGF
jgi:hypothetical protein